MTERRINFGEDQADANFSLYDTSGTGGDIVLEHLPSGDTFTYDATANDWLFDGTKVLNAASIDDTDSPYTTSGEDVIFVDNGSAAVTVELSTTDLNNKDRPITILVRFESTLNSITVTTEGAATIDPNGDTQKELGRVKHPVSFWPNHDRTVWGSSYETPFEILDSVGAGTNITVASTLEPSLSGNLDIGVSGSVWNKLWTQAIDGDGTAIDVADDLVPETDGTQALGSSSAAYSETHTESLVIGGTLYEEDDNSPIDVSGVSSHTFTLSNSADNIIIVADTDQVGFSQLQVNGDTGNNYDFVDNSDTNSTGNGQWDISSLGIISSQIELFADRSSRIGFGATIVGGGTGRVVYGQNANVSGPITQFTLLHSSATDLKARVYRRVMNV